MPEWVLLHPQVIDLLVQKIDESSEPVALESHALVHNPKQERVPYQPDCQHREQRELSHLPGSTAEITVESGVEDIDDAIHAPRVNGWCDRPIGSASLTYDDRLRQHPDD